MGDDLERELLGSTTSRRPTANDLHREQIRRMDRERKEAQEVSGVSHTGCLPRSLKVLKCLKSIFLFLRP